MLTLELRNPNQIHINIYRGLCSEGLFNKEKYRSNDFNLQKTVFISIFIHSFIHSSVRPSVRSFVRPSVTARSFAVDIHSKIIKNTLSHFITGAQYLEIEIQRDCSTKKKLQTYKLDAQYKTLIGQTALTFIKQYLFLYLFIHSFIPSFLPSFLHSFIHSFIHLFIHSFIHSFVRPSARSFVRSFVRSSIYSSLQQNHYKHSVTLHYKAQYLETGIEG